MSTHPKTIAGLNPFNHLSAWQTGQKMVVLPPILIDIKVPSPLGQGAPSTRECKRNPGGSLWKSVETLIDVLRTLRIIAHVLSSCSWDSSLMAF
jgi:hypothetical protein